MASRAHAAPPALVAGLLERTAERLQLKVPSVSVNLNRAQMLDPAVNAALIRVQDRLRPVRVVIELTEDPAATADFAPLAAQLARYVARGIEVSLDDVGVGANSQAALAQLRPYLSELKFALQDFRAGLADPALRQALTDWRDLARAAGLRFILEGIEDAAVAQAVDRLQIPFRQGYYYGKPHLLKLAPDDPDQ